MWNSFYSFYFIYFNKTIWNYNKTTHELNVTYLYIKDPGIFLIEEAMFCIIEEAMFCIIEEAMFCIIEEAMLCIIEEAMFCIIEEAMFYVIEEAMFCKGRALYYNFTWLFFTTKEETFFLFFFHDRWWSFSEGDFSHGQSRKKLFMELNDYLPLLLGLL